MIHFIPLLVSAKVVVAAVGYVTYLLAVPGGEEARRKRLEHVAHMLKKLDEAGEAPHPDKRVLIEADLELLRRNVATGWQTTEEGNAFGRVFAFGFGVDAHETLRAFGILSSEYASKIGSTLHRGLSRIFIWPTDDADLPHP